MPDKYNRLEKKCKNGCKVCVCTYSCGTGVTGPTGEMGEMGATGEMGEIGATGATGNQGEIGVTGATGPSGNQGPTGSTGPSGNQGEIGATGSIGPTGSQGTSGTIGYAEYIHTIQTPNDSIPPGTAFTIDTEVYNSVPLSIVASVGAGGTVFTLSEGVYVIDYETSLLAASSIAIYTGPNSSSLSIDPNTVSGSTTATTWIHGRAIESVSTSLVIAISSVVGSASVTTAGTETSYMIRLTILKIA
jgi:hypothetical protein